MFVSDVVAQYRSIDLRSREEVIVFLEARLAGCGATQHLLGAPVIGSGGDVLRSRCIFRAWHQAPAPRFNTTFEVFGYYHDEWRGTPDGWRIARRTVEIRGQVGDASVLAPISVGWT